MTRQSIKAIVIITLAIFSLVGQLSPVRAAGTLTISPTRTQEGSSSGVTLTLYVRGATPGQINTFYWAVLDPYGRNYTVTTSGKAPSSNYTLTEVYPKDFGPGAGINYVGQYSVAVFQAAPSISLAGAGQFGIGITDRLLYQRTQVVSIRASGYNPNDMVTISITTSGVSAPGFPERVQADASGNVMAAWLTTLSTLTGNYTVSLSGTTSAQKNPPDTQWFIIVAANLWVITEVTSTSGNVLAISATVTGPDGTHFSQGNVTSQFLASRISVGGTIRLLYDPLQGKWTGSYSVQSSDPLGVWVLQVTASDLYGNNGQGSTSLAVIPPPPPIPPDNPLTSFWFLALVTVIGAGVVIGFVFLRRKKMLPPHLQVDSQAVNAEAERLMRRNFFQSIREQISKKRESGEGEKSG